MQSEQTCALDVFVEQIYSMLCSGFYELSQGVGIMFEFLLVFFTYGLEDVTLEAEKKNLVSFIQGV